MKESREGDMLAVLIAMNAACASMFRPPWYIRAWFWLRSLFSRHGETKQDRLARWLDERREDDRSCGR